MDPITGTVLSFVNSHPQLAALFFIGYGIEKALEFFGVLKGGNKIVDNVGVILGNIVKALAGSIQNQTPPKA